MFYLDNAATTPILPAVLEKGMPFLTDYFGNPSSLHKLGMETNRAIKNARQIFASTLGVASEGVVFCGSGTEANHLALSGVVHSPSLKGKQIIVSKMEHPGVLRNAEYLESQGFQVDYIDVLPEGIIDLDHLASMVSSNTRLVSCMAINNEVGTQQPLQEIGALIKQKNVKTVFHVDAVQALTKIPISLKNTNIDLLTVSGHKIGAPKGVGALVTRGKVPWSPVILGGGQEGGKRSGTENVFGIVTFGEALSLGEKKRKATFQAMESYRERWVAFLKQNCPQITIFESPHIVPYFLNISRPPVPAEVFLHHLEAEEIYVSTGSACSSKKTIISHVFKELGFKEEIAKSMIRLSFSERNLEEDQEELFQRFLKVVQQLDDLFE